MSVLDTFVLIFDTDTDPLKKGAKESGKILDDVEKKVGETEKSTNELGDSFGGMVKNAAGALAAILSIGVVSGKVLDAANQAFEISLLSQALGVNAGELDAWGAAVERRGGDAATFNSSIASMNEKVQELSLVLENDLSPAMRELGIDFLDDAGKARNMMDILPELAGAFEKIDPAKAQGLGLRFGLDRDTILMLAEGKDAVEEVIQQQKLLGSITKEDEAVTRKWNAQLADNNRMLRSVFLGIATAVLPAMTAFFEGVEDLFIFMKDHKVFMQTFFILMATAITGSLLPAMVSLAVATWAALAPFLLFGAAIAAVALFIDDLNSYLEGNDSMIGRLIENYDKLLSKLGPLGFAIKGIIEYSKAGIGFVRGIFGGGDDEEFMGEGQGLLDTAASTPFASQSSTSLTTTANNRSNSVQIGSVEVNTQATDGEGTAKAFNDGLMSQMSQAIDDYDDGVER